MQPVIPSEISTLQDLYQHDRRKGDRYGGHGWPKRVKFFYRRFGEEGGRIRLKAMEEEGKVKFSGRGRNRTVALTPEGMALAKEMF